MTTNLLALPLVSMTVVTGTNEDWVDSILFTVDDGSGGAPEDFPQLDLTGIAFEMEVRHQAEESEVVLRASTANGKLKIGEPPNYGYLLINVDHDEMKYIRADQYVADIVGYDEIDDVRRCVIQMQLEIVIGITRP